MTESLREKLADLCHKQWSGWMKYLFELSEKQPDGSVNIPTGLVERWNRQIDTIYAELSEGEKESDREEADRVLALLSGNEGEKYKFRQCACGAYRLSGRSGGKWCWAAGCVACQKIEKLRELLSEGIRVYEGQSAQTLYGKPRAAEEEIERLKALLKKE